MLEHIGPLLAMGEEQKCVFVVDMVPGMFSHLIDPARRSVSEKSRKELERAIDVLCDIGEISSEYIKSPLVLEHVSASVRALWRVLLARGFRNVAAKALKRISKMSSYDKTLEPEKKTTKKMMSIIHDLGADLTRSTHERRPKWKIILVESGSDNQ